jgi:S-adenosylmethionine:tRNA ribosyltransferase-isomerase
MTKLGQFNFNLPEDLIADKPAIYRDESRLMVVHKQTGKIEQKIFKDIINYFDEGDIMVVNNSMVFPARLYGTKEKTGAHIEVFLLRELSEENHLWDVVVEPARKVRIGNKLIFGGKQGDILIAEVIDNTTSKGRTIRFYFDGSYEDFQKMLYRLGSTPLPKYMKREPVESDIANYQTLYAKEKGSIAAPAAGIHFSREVLKWFEIKNVDIAEITLHIGLASFKCIEVEDLSKHKMESENFQINHLAADKVNKSIANRKKVCAVGTTTIRAVESSVSTMNRLIPIEGWTEKFIFPPYDFKIINSLVTNFHSPKSPFYIATAAFGGLELVREAYKLAVKEKYRFMDYGDVMLII